MTPLRWTVTVGATTTHVATDGYELAAPVGAVDLLGRTLLADPPRPEELTNAIGEVVDHLDDVVRERPDVLAADVALAGAEVRTLAAVEVGGEPSWPMVLPRDAVEDVFRTLATERRADRRHNPGLPAEHLDSVLGAACIAVAVMRRLHLDTVTVLGEAGAA